MTSSGQIRAAHEICGLERDAVIEATKPATQSTVLSALNELLKCGDVEKTGKGVKGNPTKYRANPDIP